MAIDLNDINNKRVDTTKQRVAHAIRILNNPISCLAEGRKIDTALLDIAHAVNLLEAANQEMKWACAHYDWNDEVCFNIDSACSKLGTCMAMLLDDEDNFDSVSAGCEGQDAMTKLGKALAVLVRWFDDDQDVSEV